MNPRDKLRLTDCKIFLPKIGHIKAVVHREIIGTIKTVTISKTPTGKYFASILTENEEDVKLISFEGKVLGIDVGLTHLVITSDGSKFDNPRHLKKAENNLKRKQQKLSRKVKGSKSRDKARLLVAKAHEKIANTRKDYLHKVSKRLYLNKKLAANILQNMSNLFLTPPFMGQIYQLGCAKWRQQVSQ